MFENNLFKINYSDFYKFAISSSIILFIISIFAASLLILKFPNEVSDIGSIYHIVTTVYCLLAIACIMGMYWAVMKWKINQNKIDKFIDFELSLKEIESREKFIDLMTKSKRHDKELEREIEIQKKRIETLSGSHLVR